MDFYLVVSETDFLDYYPNNAPTDFRIHTPHMTLKGQWYVGLCEANIRAEEDCDIFIYLDVCGDTLIGGQKKPLLRKLILQRGKNDVEFKHIMYIPVVTNHFHSLRFFLDGSKALQSSNLVLHFKRFPFF